MELDTVETFGKSEVQHGKLSDRVYLMKLHKEDMPDIIKTMGLLVEKNAYTKIFAKVPQTLENQFKNFSFNREALIPKFFGGVEDCVFMSQFFNERNEELCSTHIDSILKIAQEKSRTSTPLKLTSKYQLRKAALKDIDQMCVIFSKVFDSYPFPIFDPEYIEKTMSNHVDYYVACEGKKVVSVSSAEIDPEHKNAEMTDFATLPEFRAQGIAQALLQKMEHDMKEKGIYVTYTIARALSAGMNVTFAKQGYLFAGTLVNNTNIAGKIESMNIWHKDLRE